MIVSAKTGLVKIPESVTRRQARLALGEGACEVLDTLSVDTAIPWAMRESIKSASVWYRNAQEIDELKWVLNLSDSEIDSLFIKADLL